MADEKKTIEVELISSSQKLRQDLKGVMDTVQRVNKISTGLKNTDKRLSKEAARYNAVYKKQNIKAQDQLIAQSKNLHNLMRKENKELLEKTKLGKLDQNQIAARTKRLADMAREYKKVQKMQKELGPGDGKEPRTLFSGVRGGAAGLLGSVVKSAVSFAQTMVMDDYNAAKAAAQSYHGSILGAGVTPDKAFELADLLKGETKGRKNLPILATSTAAAFGQLSPLLRAGATAGADGDSEALRSLVEITKETPLSGGDIAKAIGTFTGQLGDPLGAARTRKTLERVMATGVEAGFDGTKLPFFVQQLTSFLASTAGQTTGAVRREGILDLASRMGRAGFQGPQLFQTLQGLNKAITGAQGPSKDFLLRAVGNYGTPRGTNLGFYEATKILEGGLLDQKGKMRGGTLGLLKNIFGGAQEEIGGVRDPSKLARGSQLENLFLGQHLKMPLHAIEALRKALFATRPGQARDDAIKQILEENKDPTLRTADNTGGIWAILKEDNKISSSSVKRGIRSAGDVSKLRDGMNDVKNTLAGPIQAVLSIIASSVQNLEHMIQDALKYWSADSKLIQDALKFWGIGSTGVIPSLTDTPASLARDVKVAQAAAEESWKNFQTNSRSGDAGQVQTAFFNAQEAFNKMRKAAEASIKLFSLDESDENKKLVKQSVERYVALATKFREDAISSQQGGTAMTTRLKERIMQVLSSLPESLRSELKGKIPQELLSSAIPVPSPAPSQEKPARPTPQGGSAATNLSLPEPGSVPTVHITEASISALGASIAAALVRAPHEIPMARFHREDFSA